MSLAESAAADWALFSLAPALSSEGAFGREAARQAQQAQQAGAAAWHWHCGFRCADCACRAESCAKAHAARAAVNSNVKRIFICLAFAGKLDIFQFPIREARPPNRNFCEILDICARPLFRLPARCGLRPFGARSLSVLRLSGACLARFNVRSASYAAFGARLFGVRPAFVRHLFGAHCGG